ncbi:uncharacterized protein BDV17DRAFT_199012 [Aspergillus undulatus]|uniref:uncharacterized protein n=1 Tax=Aspergillus undulatus TaxID=1810928 RepID=UPI003CCE0334
MTQVRKAIIIGAGPAGLSVALRLHQTTNIKCTIYELRPEPTTLGGAIGIPSNGLRLLDRLSSGLYQSLLERGSSRSDLALYSRNGSILAQDEDLVSNARAETGYGYMRVKRVDVVDVLLKAVQEARIPVHFGKRATKIKERGDGVTVTFADGTDQTADILLGCDGIHSAVRQLYVDPDQKPEYSGLSGMMSIIPTAKLSTTVGKQMRGLNATFTEDGMFMAAPCTADASEVYWGFQREIPLPDTHDTRDGWEVQGRQEINGSKSSLHAVLAEARGDFNDILRELVDQTEVMKFYPVYRLPLGGKWNRGRCVLIGDAAHAMQPHAGQGVSMALEDGFLISRLLADPTRSVEEACASFQRIRTPRVEEIYRTASDNAGARKKAGPWGQWLKEIVIWASFSMPRGLGPQNRMLGQKYVVYDIDEEKI